MRAIFWVVGVKVQPDIFSSDKHAVFKVSERCEMRTTPFIVVKDAGRRRVPRFGHYLPR